MKRAEDFRRALGNAPPSFESAVRHAAQTFSWQEARMRQKHVRWSVVFALALILLLATAGIASVERWDMWNSFWKWDVQPEAEEIFTTDVEQRETQTSHASFRIKEAAYDGLMLYMTIEITPREDAFLVCEDACEDAYEDAYENAGQMPVSSLSLLYAQEQGTVLEYANRLEKQPVYCDVQPQLWDYYNENTYRERKTEYLDDGTVLMMFAYTDVPEEALQNMEITCTTNRYDADWQDSDVWHRGTDYAFIECNISRTADAVVVRNEQPVEIVGFGLCVDDVTYTHTPMADRIFFSVIAEEGVNIEDYSISQYTFRAKVGSWEYVPEENRYDCWWICEPEEKTPEGVLICVEYKPDQRYVGMRTVPLVAEE